MNRPTNHPPKMLANVASSSGHASLRDAPEGVAIIHGLGSNRWLMKPLEWRLKQTGYRTVNFGYRSFFKSVEDHARSFFEFVSQLENDAELKSWHILAHSLGCIVTRKMLENHSFDRLHRVAMLAPPNAGSPAATRLSYLLPLSQTVRQISDRPDSDVQSMGPSQVPEGVEFGVLAASYDFVVTDQSSRLPIDHQHHTIFSGHNGLLVRKPAAEATIRFLQTGSFDAP